MAWVLADGGRESVHDLGRCADACGGCDEERGSDAPVDPQGWQPCQALPAFDPTNLDDVVEGDLLPPFASLLK